MSRLPSCVAVLCVRNEAAHLRRAIGNFISQGIDVALIDHASTDASPEIYRDFLGQGLLTVRRLAWEGEYNQTAQLQAKQVLIAGLPHDWVIHADADEYMHTSREGESVLEGIARVEHDGYNAVNFEEFVFLPAPDSVLPPEDCERELLDYYFFAPSPRRLMRAWQRGHGFDNTHSGGHMLRGSNLRLAPENFVLRHYIVMSQLHAIEKYAGRIFAPGDLERGWHQNRLGLGPEQLKLPDRRVLHHLSRWDEATLDRSNPKALHFWQWPESARVPSRAGEDFRYEERYG